MSPPAPIPIPNFTNLFLVPISLAYTTPHLNLIRENHEHYSKYIYKFRKENWEENEVDMLRGAQQDWEERFGSDKVPLTLNFSIQRIVRESRSIIGVVGLLRINNGEAEIGYLVDPQEAGKGIMTQASKCLLDTLWRDNKLIPLVRVTLHTSQVNGASKRLAVKLGFQMFEESDDDVWYAITKEQWLEQEKCE